MNNLNIEKLRDHKWYLENFCKIRTKDKGIQPFILNEMQKDLFNTLRVSKSVKVMLLKARQLGSSTGTAGFFYVDTITNPGVTTGLIGYNQQMVDMLFNTIKMLYETTPKEMRPEINKDNRLEFAFPKMNSRIIILPNTKNSGRGFTFQNLLVTELPMWENAEETMAGLTEAAEYGRIVIEGTPKGMGNKYHRMWVTDNEYIKKKYGWWWGYSKEWADRKRKTMTEQLWSQEYGLKFLTSGRPVFPTSLLDKIQKGILKIGDKRIIKRDGEKEFEFIVKEDDFWTVYEEPIPEKMYIMGVDVGEGVEGGDYSVATIWNRHTGEEVAFYRKQVSTDIFGKLLNEWGRKYNNALLTHEVNSIGRSITDILRKLCYPNFYFRKGKIESISSTTTDLIGWRTTYTNKPFLLDDFRGAVVKDEITIHSQEILNEMQVTVYNDNGDIVVPDNFHNDSLMSAAIGYQGYKVLWTGKLDQVNLDEYIPEGFTY